jgi:hypothetical protein
MKDLYDAFLLGKFIINKQSKIQAARKVAATTAATATFNVANTSIISYTTSVNSSTSTLNNVNKITASFKSTIPPLSGHSSTSSLHSSNDKTRDSLDMNHLSNHLLLFSH